jgi:hypothetical protein
MTGHYDPARHAEMTGHDPAAQAAVTAGARPVLLVRSRPGTAGQAAHPVHLIPLPLRSEPAGGLGALCGAWLGADQMETVTPGEGVPCTLCLVIHISDSPAPPPTTPPVDDPEPGLLAAVSRYLSWGWPVTLRRDQSLAQPERACRRADDSYCPGHRGHRDSRRSPLPGAGTGTPVRPRPPDHPRLRALRGAAALATRRTESHRGAAAATYGHLWWTNELGPSDPTLKRNISVARSTFSAPCTPSEK